MTRPPFSILFLLLEYVLKEREVWLGVTPISRLIRFSPPAGAKKEEIKAIELYSL